MKHTRNFINTRSSKMIPNLLNMQLSPEYKPGKAKNSKKQSAAVNNNKQSTNSSQINTVGVNDKCQNNASNLQGGKKPSSPEMFLFPPFNHPDRNMTPERNMFPPGYPPPIICPPPQWNYQYPQGVGNFPQPFGNFPQVPMNLPQMHGHFPQNVGNFPPVLVNWPPFPGQFPQGVGNFPQPVGNFPPVPVNLLQMPGHFQNAFLSFPHVLVNAPQFSGNFPPFPGHFPQVPQNYFEHHYPDIPPWSNGFDPNEVDYDPFESDELTPDEELENHSDVSRNNPGRFPQVPENHFEQHFEDIPPTENRFDPNEVDYDPFESNELTPDEELENHSDVSRNNPGRFPQVPQNHFEHRYPDLPPLANRFNANKNQNNIDEWASHHELEYRSDVRRNHLYMVDRDSNHSYNFASKKDGLYVDNSEPKSEPNIMEKPLERYKYVHIAEKFYTSENMNASGRHIYSYKRAIMATSDFSLDNKDNMTAKEFFDALSNICQPFCNHKPSAGCNRPIDSYCQLEKRCNYLKYYNQEGIPFLENYRSYHIEFNNIVKRHKDIYTMENLFDAQMFVKNRMDSLAESLYHITFQMRRIYAYVFCFMETNEELVCAIKTIQDIHERMKPDNSYEKLFLIDATLYLKNSFPSTH